MVTRTAFRTLIAGTELRICQVVVVLAALLSAVTWAIGVVAPVIALLRCARIAEIAAGVFIWAAFLGWVASRASQRVV